MERDKMGSIRFSSEPTSKKTIADVVNSQINTKDYAQKVKKFKNKSIGLFGSESKEYTENQLTDMLLDYDINIPERIDSLKLVYEAPNVIFDKQPFTVSYLTVRQVRDNTYIVSIEKEKSVKDIQAAMQNKTLSGSTNAWYQ